MIQFAANSKIIVMHDAISFRYGIDKTASIARIVLKNEPMSGAYFVFRSKMGNSLRILHYDGSGFWLCTKRLSCGAFKYWPKGSDDQSVSCELLAREMQILLWGGDPYSCHFPEIWRKVS